MGKLKKGLILTVVVLVLLAGAFVGGFILKGSPEPQEPPKPTISGNIIQQEISEISELAVLHYRYTNVGKFEDHANIKTWKVPLSSKSFILSYSGDIKLGIDLKAVEVSVDEESSEVLLTLPPVKILSHAIDESSIEVWDQTKNIFNQIKIEEYAEFVTDQKKVFEKNGIGADLKAEATEAAKKQLVTLVRNFAGIKDEYTVAVK